MPTLDELRARLPDLTARDEHRLGRQLARRDVDLDELARSVDDAAARVEARRAALPRPAYPSDLPIVERREELLAAIRDHQVVVVAGETGSGKSTQLPKLCLELGRGVRGLIGHTQPRRIAARAVAERVAEELGTDIGGAVGYTVRFTDRVGDATYLKVMTDGILLAELQRDRLLLAYDTIILDEAHERSLNVDFLLGYLNPLLPKRPDLKVLITSATIDTERFARHFGDAPVVEVSGRTYPVELRYRPVGEHPDDDRDQVQAICDAVEELGAEGPGDVLVFLSGEREIRDTVDALDRLRLPSTEIVPLFARLSAEEQHRVFRPHRGRRIVCATNVAETSLTVPGIRYVIDPGTARISRYNRRTKVQRLPIEAISQASAAQRAGRCGRIGPGICIRLYGEDDFAGRPEFTDPEILRTNLASVILRMAAIGLGDVARFPFVDPPDARAIGDGVALLRELGALDGDRLTPIGRRLAQLPIDPRLGRMVLEADRNGCARDVLVVAAALSIQDPRERPTGKEQAADALHARFVDPTSDFVTYLNLWRHLRHKQRELGSSAFRRMCKSEHLHHLRVREWQDLHGQLRQVARSIGVDVDAGHDPGDPEGLDRDRVHQSLLAGLLSHVGTWDPTKREYLGARQARFSIGTGSALAKQKPRWVMAAELVETNRMWARIAARIDPAWIERLAGDLVKRSYGDPWWDEERGAAMTNERVTLYGLTVVPSRRVQYARVDPAGARAIFLRRALVDGDWDSHHAFLERNRELVEEIRELEHRVRRGGLLVGDDALVDFYDERVPADVVSGRHFDRWWRDRRAEDPDFLTFTRELLLDPAAAAAVDPDAFPDAWQVGGLSLPLTYTYEPGAVLDGVTVDVPLAVLHRVDARPFEWQVPGLREELVTALIRTLPKPVRRSFVPAPDFARAVLDRVGPDGGPLLDVLTRELRRLTGDPIPPGSWNVDALPDHLRITFRAVDDGGRPVAWSKDLGALRQRLAPRIEQAVAQAAPSVEQRGLTAWTIGELPRIVETERDGHVVTAYPALVDEGDTVAVRALPTEAAQARAMRPGTRRLLLLGLPSPPSQLQRLLPNATKLALAAWEGTVTELVEDCVAAAVDQLLDDAGGPAWDAEAFEKLQRHVRDGVTEVALDALQVAGAIAVAARDVEARADRLVAVPLQPSVADVRAQLDRLTQPGFVSDAGTRRLRDVLRYIRAAERRLEKLPSDPARDRRLMQQVHELEDHPRAHRVRWLLEELRVSLFAQALGTAQPVSVQRIQKELARG